MDLAPELSFLASSRQSNIEDIGDRPDHGLVTAPLFTASALRAAGAAVFPLRGLLGVTTNDDMVYFNTNTPSSGVVCGMQGSGKSHTVSCLLENALVVDPRIGNLSQPLAALVFHFDEEDGDRPCEAAYLGTPTAASNAHVRHVTVIASSMNIANRRRAYARFENVDVQPLILGEDDITAPRLLALMGWSEDAGENLPLYMHEILQIVHNIGIEGFSYAEFKRRIEQEKFNAAQHAMLAHRLRLLEGFVQPTSQSIRSYFSPGDVVLVDLTDPFLNGWLASLLFDIVLSSFVAWKSPTGKIVVLDEAHKYLTNSEASRFNRSIATIIRQERHLATRVIIATQEPTVVPATILDLSSFIACHRFTSPSWCSHLVRHVSSGDKGWFNDVMNLATGHAIVFSPTTRVANTLSPLGMAALNIRVRPRITSNGGASVLAIEPTAPERSAENVHVAPRSMDPMASLPPLTSADSVAASNLSSPTTSSTTHVSSSNFAPLPTHTSFRMSQSAVPKPVTESNSGTKATPSVSNGALLAEVLPSTASSSSFTPVTTIEPLRDYYSQINELKSPLLLPLAPYVRELTERKLRALVSKLHAQAIVTGSRAYLPLDSIRNSIPCDVKAGISFAYDDAVLDRAISVAKKMGVITCLQDTQGQSSVCLLPLEQWSASAAEYAAVFERTSKPDRDAYNVEQDFIRAELEALQLKLTAVKYKIGLFSKVGPAADRRTALRAELGVVRSSQRNHKASRARLFDEIRAIQESTNKRIKDIQDAKQKAPFQTIADVDTAIKSLDLQVESGALTIVQEKRAIADISTFKSARKALKVRLVEELAIQKERARADELRTELEDPEAKALSNSYEAIKKELEEMKKEGDEAYANRAQLFDERDALQKHISELHDRRRVGVQTYHDAIDRYRKKLNVELDDQADSDAALIGSQTSSDSYPGLELYLAKIQMVGKHRAIAPRVRGMIQFLYRHWVATGESTLLLSDPKLGNSLRRLSGKMRKAAVVAEELGVATVCGEDPNHAIQLVILPTASTSTPET